MSERYQRVTHGFGSDEKGIMLLDKNSLRDRITAFLIMILFFFIGLGQKLYWLYKKLKALL